MKTKKKTKMPENKEELKAEFEELFGPAKPLPPELAKEHAKVVAQVRERVVKRHTRKVIAGTMITHDGDCNIYRADLPFCSCGLLHELKYLGNPDEANEIYSGFIKQYWEHQERGHEEAVHALESLKKIREIIERVENRCMAADGPITRTLDEMQDREIKAIWKLVKDA